jgi:hypothetical protein
MSITLTFEEREALYEQILDRLSGIGDVWLAVCREDYEEAERLARIFADDLVLVSEGLGWGDLKDESFELHVPSGVLRRALSGHCQAALARDAREVPEREECRERKERNHLIVQACRRVLGALDGVPPAVDPG